MKFHAFSPRASATAVGIAVLLICGNAAGAMAAVASTPAPVAPQVTTTATAGPDTPVPPGAPTGLTAVPGNGTVTLSWSAPSSDGGAPVDGYFIAGGTSPSSTSFTELVGGTTATMSHLTNGTTYFFRVSAENFTGDGPAVTVTVTPQGPGSGSGSAPGAPAGLKVSSGDGFVALSWSPPPGGLKDGQGYLIYMGTSPGHEGARPSVPYLIQFTTHYTVAPLKDGTRYYFQVALLDRDNQLSARSAEVSAVPGVGAGAAPGPAPGAGARSGGGKNTQPTAAPLPTAILDGHHASSSPATGLIVLLAALSLAGTGGAIAIVLIQRRRRRHGPGHAPVPAPRRPHDDQRSRVEELNGPRYR